MNSAEIQTKYDHRLRLLLVGDRSVGKTQIQNRFTNDQFRENAPNTIVCDFNSKKINVNDQRVKLQTWEKIDVRRFSTINNQYRDSNGIVLVYDCTQDETFNNISYWLREILCHARSGVAKVLVANKTDLPNRSISTERGQSLAQEYGLKFFETSAKTGTNINEMFLEITQQIICTRLSETKAKLNIEE